MSHLDECISLGHDFAGRLSFEEIVHAIRSRRFEIVSIWRDKGTYPPYEVVLKARR